MDAWRFMIPKFDSPYYCQSQTVLFCANCVQCFICLILIIFPFRLFVSLNKMNYCC